MFCLNVIGVKLLHNKLCNSCHNITAITCSLVFHIVTFQRATKAAQYKIMFSLGFVINLLAAKYDIVQVTTNVPCPLSIQLRERMSPTEATAAILAAICHDLDHPGKNHIYYNTCRLHVCVYMQYL